MSGVHASLTLQLHRLLEMAVQGGMESSCSRLTRVFPGVVGEEFERALSSTHPNQCSTILDWLCGRVEEVCVQPLSAHLSVEGKHLTLAWFPW